MSLAQSSASVRRAAAVLSASVRMISESSSGCWSSYARALLSLFLSLPLGGISQVTTSASTKAMSPLNILYNLRLVQIELHCHRAKWSHDLDNLDYPNPKQHPANTILVMCHTSTDNLRFQRQAFSGWENVEWEGELACLFRKRDWPWQNF